MLAVGGLPVFNVVVVKFYINCMVAINRCMIVLVLILIYTSLTVNYSYLRIIRLTISVKMLGGSLRRCKLLSLASFKVNPLR